MTADPFHLDPAGNLVGHGMTIPADEQIAPGVVLLTAELLERMWQLAQAEAQLPAENDPVRRMRARMRGAIEDLAEDLGIDPAGLK